MAENINGYRLGLTFGIILGAMHAIWAIIIAVAPGLMQSFLDWMFELHFLNKIYTITTFNAVNALMLIVITFVCGYVLGWLLAFVWNKTPKSN